MSDGSLEDLIVNDIKLSESCVNYEYKFTSYNG